MRGVDQTANHHLDVYDHTMAVLERLLEVESDLERFAGERAEEARELLDEPLADELTRGEALRFGALVHDLGKPVDQKGVRRPGDLHGPRPGRGRDHRRDAGPPAGEPGADPPPSGA